MSDTQLTEEDERAYRHLSGRAFASLDEHEETDLVKRRQAVERRLNKLGITEDDANRNQAKRFLILFSDCETAYKTAAKKCGLSLTDLYAAFEMWPEGKMVKDYLMKVKLDLTRVEDLEDLKKAREAMRDTIDNEGRDRAKAAMFMMSKLDKSQFGDEFHTWRGGDDGKAKAQVVYNLPGLTVNMITAPQDSIMRLDQEQIKPAINI